MKTSDRTIKRPRTKISFIIIKEIMKQAMVFAIMALRLFGVYPLENDGGNDWGDRAGPGPRPGLFLYYF